MFARFDENPAMTLRVIKETKRYGRTDGRTDGHTDGRTDGRTDNVKTVYPLQTKFAGGIISFSQKTHHWLAKNSAKARPSIWQALSHCPIMLLLGFIQAKKGSPPTYVVIFTKVMDLRITVAQFVEC